MEITGKHIDLTSVTLPQFMISSLQITGKASAKQWTLYTAIHFPKQDAITFTAATQLDPVTFVPTTTKGTLHIGIQHRQMFNVFLPDLYQLKGALSEHITFLAGRVAYITKERLNSVMPQHFGPMQGCT